MRITSSTPHILLLPIVSASQPKTTCPAVAPAEVAVLIAV